MGRRAPLAPFREHIMCNTRKPLPQHRLSWNQGQAHRWDTSRSGGSSPSSTAGFLVDAKMGARMLTLRSRLVPLREACPCLLSF